MIIGKCTSCGGTISEDMHYSKFKCPQCGEVEIIRCETCKKNGNKYVCPKCGFVGP